MTSPTSPTSPAHARRAALAAALTALLATGLGLSGCGVNEAAAAAVVDGRVISEEEAHVAAAETNAGAEGLTTQFTAKATLPWLILAPYVLDQAAREGKGVSETQARSALTKLADPSPSTLQFVRAYIAAQSSLSQEGIDQVLAEVRKATISVNPRYGRFDPASPGQLRDLEPDWLAPAPAPTAEPDEEATPAATPTGDG